MGKRVSKGKKPDISIHLIQVDALGPDGKIYKAQFEAIFPKGTTVTRLQESKRDPHEVYKALSDTYALLEESSRSQINNIIDKVLDFAREIRTTSIQERIRSVERVYRQGE